MTWSFVECFIVIWKCAFCRNRRIQIFSYELWWIKEWWQVLKYLVFTYPYRYQSGDLKLCTFSFSFGDVYIIRMEGLSYELWWIQEEWRVCNSWCLLLDGQLEILQTLSNALLLFVDVCIDRIGGSSNCLEFWWIHRGVGCEITSAHFSS
jgi:hypothetical protein